MFNDYIPNIVDHIDGNSSNNCIENLRDANKAQNGWNSKLNKNNSSGIRGVSWNKQTKKWIPIKKKFASRSNFTKKIDKLYEDLFLKIKREFKN